MAPTSVTLSDCEGQVSCLKLFKPYIVET